MINEKEDNVVFPNDISCSLSVFRILILGFKITYGLNDLNDLNEVNGSNQGSVSWRKT